MSDLGMAYLETGRVADAERVFKWAVATGSEYASAYNGLGLVDVRKQDLPGSRRHFGKAVQLDPGLLEAQLNLGRIYKMMGANTRARAAFEAFLTRASRAEYAGSGSRIRRIWIEDPATFSQTLPIAEVEVSVTFKRLITGSSSC